MSANRFLDSNPSGQGPPLHDTEEGRGLEVSARTIGVARFEESDERPNDPPPTATLEPRKAEAMAIDDRDWPRITEPADRVAGSSRDLVVAATGVLVVVTIGLLHGVDAPAILIGVFAIIAAVLVLRLVDRGEGVEAPRRQATERIWPDTGMKAAVEALPDPCFIVDQRGLVRYANSAALQRGATARIGEPLSFFVRAPQLHDTLDGVRLTGEADTVEWQERGGAERWLAASITPVRMPADRGSRAGADRVTFHLVYMEDRTDEHRVERMRVDFVANASHELRTPLASLTGFIETLQGPAKNDPNAHHARSSAAHETLDRRSFVLEPDRDARSRGARHARRSDGHHPPRGRCARARRRREQGHRSSRRAARAGHPARGSR
jgi:signal transduction histidine kinase